MQAVASALAADLFPAKRGIVINACQIAFAAGAVVGPGSIYLLLVSGASWRSVYIGMGVIAAALVCLLAAQRLARASIGQPTLAIAVVSRLLLQPAFVCLCIAQLFYAGAEVGFFEWMPTYFGKALHGPAAAANVGKVVSVFWMAMTAGRLAMGGLLGRFDSLKLGITLACTGAAAALLALDTQRPQVVMLFVAATGLCYGGIYSAILVETGDRFHASSVLGAALGGVAAAGSVGSSCIPWAVGAVAASSGQWRIGLSLAPTSALISAVLLAFVLMQRRIEHHRPDFS